MASPTQHNMKRQMNIYKKIYKNTTGENGAKEHMKQYIQANRKRQVWRMEAAFLLLFILFFLLLVWNINTGSVKVSVEEIIKILVHRGGDETVYNIIWKIRLPRIFTAAILGGALALAGFLLQTFFNNPIAGPYILGISSGAKLDRKSVV